MSQLTRRGILKQGVLTAAAGLGTLGGQPAAWAIPPIGRTRPSHLKLSIAAYSYRDYLTSKPPRMNLFQYVDLAADMGLDAVEPTSYYFPPDVTTDYLYHLKQHAFLLGLDISGTAIGNNFCLPPGPERDEQLASTRSWIDRAAELDAPVIRIFAGSVPRGESEEQAVAWAIEGIKESLSYAARKGITLALENHGGITATPRQILKLVTAVDGPNFGVNLHTGNFHGDDPYAEIAELAPARFKSRLQLSGRVGFSKLSVSSMLGLFVGTNTVSRRKALGPGHTEHLRLGDPDHRPGLPGSARARARPRTGRPARMVPGADHASGLGDLQAGLCGRQRLGARGGVTGGLARLAGGHRPGDHQLPAAAGHRGPPGGRIRLPRGYPGHADGAVAAASPDSRHPGGAWLSAA